MSPAPPPLLSAGFAASTAAVFRGRDARLLMTTVFLRMFSFGFVAVVLFLYLRELGYTNMQIGNLFTFILLGDLVITLYLTTHAARLGRKTVLLASAGLKIFSGIVFAFFPRHYLLLVVAGTVGVISSTGGDIGPFKAVEQAALSQLTSLAKQEVAFSGSSSSSSSPSLSNSSPSLPSSRSPSSDVEDHDVHQQQLLEEQARARARARARALVGSLNWMTGYYTLVSAWSLSLGALASGLVSHCLQKSLGFTPLAAYAHVMLGYAICGALMLVVYSMLSGEIEAPLASRQRPKNLFGLESRKSTRVVGKLSFLFTIDAFAGGLVMQTFISYWFFVRFGTDEQYLGVLLMGANFVAGLSALAASPLAARFGEINTMVFTHFPSNVLLLLVPFMPSEFWACVVLILRFSISQMDVPARNAYVLRVVAPSERDAANGLTNLIRSVGVALSPSLLAAMIEGGERDPRSLAFAMPFVVSGVVKCAYDVLVYLVFNDVCCGEREDQDEPGGEVQGEGERAQQQKEQQQEQQEQQPQEHNHEGTPLLGTGAH